MTDYNYIGKIPFVNYKCDKMGQIFSMNRNEEWFFVAIPSVCRVRWKKCGCRTIFCPGGLFSENMAILLSGGA